MTSIKPEYTSTHNQTIHGAPEGQDARILAEKARALMPEDKVLVHVALDDRRMETLEDLLGFFAPDVQILKFPAWDCLPYDRVSPNADIAARRVATLTGLLAWHEEKKRYPRVLLTTVNALSQKVMPRVALKSASFSALKNSRLDLDDLTAYLVSNGYIRTDTVREAGEYAVRGGIVDIFPAGFSHPVRLDLFGDEVESIKGFDPLTQVSVPSSQVQDDLSSGLHLTPATEYMLDDASIARFRSQYRALFGVVRENDPLYESVSEGRRYNGVEHWQPLFFENMETVFDYVPDSAVTLDHHTLESYQERVIQIKDFYETRKTLQASKTTGAVYNPLPVSSLYVEDWVAVVGDVQVLSPFASASGAGEAKKGRDFVDIRALPDGDVFGALKDYLEGYRNKKSLITCYSPGSLDRVKGLMDHAGFEHLIVIHEGAELRNIKPHQIALTVLALEHGFVAGDLTVVTEQDILGDRLARKTRKTRKADNFLTEVSTLNEGDHVVHIDHGVGRFVELETVSAGKTLHDCLKIEYAGGDRLYVPVENIEVLSRFGDADALVQLDKLGGAGWQARKARVKKNLMEMADGLLKIAAARMLKKAEKLDVDQAVYNQFAAKFPYQETEDQDRAINDVIADLSSEHPMDRLVCGDVGFGKTEVAIRAAYVAAMDGAQVAVVVPTTLLARQHYQNFMKRFAGTPLRVAQLSRMVGSAEAQKVKEGLADGSVNIVIGTHALFGKGIKFNHLGLLIVDEEQRFGVKQKERLKELKNNVHILTLTATPIPRTLQMSLTGVKDMSLITTPPVDRLAVRTFVLPFDSMVIREALMREHYRGGQSFYVCPRISDIREVEEELKELVPELKLVVAHGQMPPTDLDERMTAFYDGQYDVLLATNIIESGIDIPTANTMIVHRSDMFGLAQLYQIRGRIGRSKVRAYAYLTYPPHQKLNPQAQKRLEVMETLDTLGSGFQIASHDMDIRGSGNLLGDQQSGHIKEVGVELYQQMLEDAVAAARAGAHPDDMPDETWSPTINLGTSVLIPESYVPDLGVRMSLYRRLAELNKNGSLPPAGGEGAVLSSEIEAFAAELIDRFGPIPKEVQNLLDIVDIKALCKKAGVDHVEAGPKGVVIGFYQNTPPHVEGLMAWITSKGGTVKLRPDQKLAVIRQWESPEKRVRNVKAIMVELSGL